MLELTQNQALRFIYNIKGQISFTELKAEKDFESLAESKLQLRKDFVCKIVGGDVDIPIRATIIKDYGEHPDIEAPPASGTRHGRFCIPFIQSNQLFYFFWHKTARNIRESQKKEKNSNKNQK